jgi:hypothetical protein
MPTDGAGTEGRAQREGAAALLVIALCLMVIGMVWSLDYPFPSGKLDFWGFVGIWLREIFILGSAVIVLLYVGYTKAVNFFRKRRKTDAL